MTGEKHDLRKQTTNAIKKQKIKKKNTKLTNNKYLNLKNFQNKITHTITVHQNHEPF